MPRFDGYALTENNFLGVDVVLNITSNRATLANLLSFLFLRQLYAYVNHCMHMHKPLNGQQAAIFLAVHHHIQAAGGEGA